MSKVFWQAKIWGLLHDPVFKALHDDSGRGRNSEWQQLAVMQDWVTNGLNPETAKGGAMRQIKLADFITSASDRSAIGNLSVSVDYAEAGNRDLGLKISHLLSGKLTDFKLQTEEHDRVSSSSRLDFLTGKEADLFKSSKIRDRDGELKSIAEIEDPQRLFWWLWRCLPIAACKAMGDDEALLLMPAETRIPDASIWSHTSLTAAMAGALTGFDLTLADLKPSNQIKPAKTSRAYLATFSFTPVQELIKASRKMRDFWAGSWLLHYLSARVSWKLALQYGPDSLVYPSLFQQPLIDSWLLEKWPEFKEWIKSPSERQLLTAGFPNVIVMLLPEDKVDAAMQTAKQLLREEWLKIGDLVFDRLRTERNWMPKLVKEHITWNGWLETQWQSYWSAMPVGDKDLELTSHQMDVPDLNIRSDQSWRNTQNQTFQVGFKQKLFTKNEDNFLHKIAEKNKKEAEDKERKENKQNKQKPPFKANVGSWWPHIFDRTRANVSAIKNARTWKLPTVFDTRSTISGLGSIVHPFEKKHQVSSSEAQSLWQQHAGLFDGREQLNATEVVKRGLHLAIPQLVPGLAQTTRIDASYPDLTAGVVGYLKTSSAADLQNFKAACNAVEEKVKSRNFKFKNLPEICGIPWTDNTLSLTQQKYHSRHLSPGWLVEDLEIDKDKKQELKVELDRVVSEYYPGNNPADWYVLAAGDGDGMSEWLKGKKLKQYQHYLPTNLVDKVRQNSQEVGVAFDNFITEQKRMGPSTHAALSRALLDFSNQLVPYLTEQRYAGRLVYSGGDDVLAYTNLWEWDKWLWDVRECFRGQSDPKPEPEFESSGDYWRWKDPLTLPAEYLSNRPLFTMGEAATISFGIVIANQGVPLAIALEQMWEAETGAKDHFCETLAKEHRQKNAVQVRVLYGNGNVLKATAKFEAFKMWRGLVDPKFEPALFEQAAQIWAQHPVPSDTAIVAWINAFSDRRDVFKDRDLGGSVGVASTFAEDHDRDLKQEFITHMSDWLTKMWETNDKSTRDDEIGYWLKLAAFVLRKRDISIKSGGSQ
ncbi:type III-B CRISPR-associated protein Cas10/Cmr2 [Chamaesiphon sp.]|uniref:type III-B CRISPR-associated protein Cas10/Cmr2 n=1 Tax=Chamaesiphon sp. TaxID=2814140 RepID=UPI0035934154